MPLSCSNATGTAALVISGLLLGGCASNASSNMASPVWDTTLNDSVIANTLGVETRTVYLSWRCNAEGGGFGHICTGYKLIPDPTTSDLPPDLIHCKTKTTIIKRDAGTTSARWKAARSDRDIIIFRHSIRAETDFFGGGKEISVAYEHLLIFRKDKTVAGSLLGCTFSIEENV